MQTCRVAIHVRYRSRGFSFTEILFAVIVLGIGFIMIAAIFPVAIQQGKLTSEQGSATGVAREALNYLAQIGSNSDSIPDSGANPNSGGGPLFPATGLTPGSSPYLGMVYSMRDPQPAGAVYPLDAAVKPSQNNLLTAITPSPDNLWNRLNLSLVVPSDQRYAFVGLYRRNGDPNDRRTWSPFAQVWFIPVTTRNRTIYNPGRISSNSNTLGADIYNATAGATVNLQARLAKVEITDPSGTFPTTGNTGYVLLNYTAMPGAPATYTPGALSENCYVIIANDESKPTTLDGYPNPDIGRMNGRMYHVGLRRPDLDGANPTNGPYTAYDLAPDGNFAPDAGSDGFFGKNTNAASHVPPLTTDDDILAVGNSQPVNSGLTSQIWANGPADAYVVGLDANATDAFSSQDISAFSTFIKVN